MSDFSRRITHSKFDFFLSVDCEGPIFDKNLENNVLNMERFLKLNTENDIYTLLFITPYFAMKLDELNLIEKIKNEYLVVFGLHIHPNNLPEHIQEKCSFLRDDLHLLADYNYHEQKEIINNCYEYLHKLSINPIEGFRGGYFSIDNNTVDILKKNTDIYFESHNIHRKEYKVINANHLISSYPVYSKDAYNEFRLEYFESEKLISIINDALLNNSKVIGITHSYLFDDKDFHYKRDGIGQSIYSRLNDILRYIKFKNSK
ncbi:hypothetical protein SAMN05443428_10457 [Caloramator quimbayensis]|uniref:Polysaccharide deacetylase n=1 Tax=Caloramator quimbayensis TaxID=1147123 RepID=A0A1T4WVM1_9CLOT|nr:hypothetical protein [Caloramator quimbayensis]SKA81420.1 hypothetical protein SAMN05443428_10457 [Caloramator quimbayensis]